MSLLLFDNYSKSMKNRKFDTYWYLQALFIAYSNELTINLNMAYIYVRFTSLIWWALIQVGAYSRGAVKQGITKSDLGGLY